MTRLEYAWYRWFPAKARSSARWLQLTLEQEGYYRRLYDLAALSEPAAKRGWLYCDSKPMSLELVHKVLNIPHADGELAMRSLLDLHLITRNKGGAYGFANFSKHQRGANLQVRGGEAGLRPKRDRSETESRRERDADIDIEIEVEKEKEEEGNNGDARASEELERIPLPPGATHKDSLQVPGFTKPSHIEGKCRGNVNRPGIPEGSGDPVMDGLVTGYHQRFPASKWGLGMRHRLIQDMHEAILRGASESDLFGAMDTLKAQGNRAPTPWEITKEAERARASPVVDAVALSAEHERKLKAEVAAAKAQGRKG